ncbi:preprotein translocase subunit SecY [Candidatus Phycosocius spiralis]|uniref:Protein translocase subunit SecY n=1 Tax=Candidatus Phycosocius spiralis TaxID=2815099 RepID=A0ABQ4PY27_9PROT|nr:preprotein translocase subunit SecY [Candidatus Phycosocius spiralis]GIU67957.1 protein translocase subunit SecY [Candidatus Phycosocius spiralis]
MASAAEQLARNLNFSSFAKAKDLHARILFTVFALVCYRLGTFIPIPGIDIVAFARAFSQAQQGILGMANMFSGGAVERLAIFALNVMPYISASIIIQLLSSFPGRFEQLKKEGEAGRAQLNQYTRYLTVVLAIAQSLTIANGLAGSPGIVLDPGPLFIASTVITLTGGTLLLMWIGEQITSRGIGNGVSLIIFAGIVAEVPKAIFRTLTLAREGSVSGFAILVLVLVLALAIVLIVFVERSQRRIVVQYPKRQIGNKMSMGEQSFLPLKINTSGVIPPIFASSLLLLPATAAGFLASGQLPDNAPDWRVILQEGVRATAALLGHGKPLFISLFGALIVFFCFFYTSIVFNTEETADNLRKHGGFLPGIRPGAKTAEYLDLVMSRLTLIGAVYLVIVCLVPEILISSFGMQFYLGGTSLLIVVSVTIDTVAQIQSHMLAHQYEGMIKKSKLKGRGR